MTMKRKVIIIVSIILLIGVGVAIILSQNNKVKDNPNNQPAESKPEVKSKQVVEAFGIVKAREYKDINLDFPAQIVSVPVKDGQNVSLDEVLIHLNITDFQAMIKSKENELNSARFELQKLSKNLRDAEESYEKAKRQLADKKLLYLQGIISEQEVEDFEDLVKERERAVTDIKLGLSSAHSVSGIEVQAERVAVLEYDLKRMKAKLNQSFLKGNTIISDFPNAVVYDINCAAGYSVGTGERQEKLLSIMNLNSLYVTADVSEEFIRDVKIGAPVVIIPVSDTSRNYNGKVVRIADMAVKKDGETTIEVEISIENIDSFLKPNFNVDVEIMK